MTAFRTGLVTALLSERAGLQRVEVDGEPSYVLTHLIGPVAVGDRVVVNTTAVDIGLGTGGWHVVHWNLSRSEWASPEAGAPPADRVMKLRYTSLQADVAPAEIASRPHQAVATARTPVVACSVHSQVAAVAVAFRALAGEARRLAYVMTDGGALPLALSDLTADLRDRGLLATTVTCGHAFGGELEAVNVYSAIDVAVAVAGAEAVVVGPGPGIVGTGSALGHTGVEVAAIIDAAGALGARAVVAVRWSDVDARDRHRGLSHHTVTALQLANHGAVVAAPNNAVAPPQLHDAATPPHSLVAVAVPDMAALLAEAKLTVTTMGRTLDADPAFFSWAGAAGTAAASLLEGPLEL